MTHNAISHDMSPGTHPADHLGSFYQWTKVWIFEQKVRGDDSSVGSVSRRSWFVGSTDNVLACDTLDAVGTDDEVGTNNLAGLESEGWYGWIHGDDAALGTYSDARMTLCEFVDHAVKVCSL